MKKQKLTVFFLLGLLLCFFFFPSLCFSGAKGGLTLWFYTIIPSLLPFLIVSNLILHLNLLPYLTPILAPVFQRLFSVSKAGCYPILIGLLSGYPMGAKACADLVRKEEISQKEGQYLLSFVNNASPMFITSFVATQCLQLPSMQYIFYGLILGSAFLCSLISRILLQKNFTTSSKIIAEPNQNKTNNKLSFATALDASILDAFTTITKVGGFIILFSILGEFVLALPSCLGFLRYLFLCILEITTAIHFISLSTYSMTIKIILILATTTFGGLSGLFQTQSVIAGSGLSLTYYIFTKMLQSILVLLGTILLLIFIT